MKMKIDWIVLQVGRSPPRRIQHILPTFSTMLRHNLQKSHIRAKHIKAVHKLTNYECMNIKKW